MIFFFTINGEKTSTYNCCRHCVRYRCMGAISSYYFENLSQTNTRSSLLTKDVVVILLRNYYDLVFKQHA